MPFVQEWLEVDFGASSAGLATVGFRLYKADGTDAAARTTAGVVELGAGAYGVPTVSIPDTAKGIQWDTGTATPLYAVEELNALRYFATNGPVKVVCIATKISRPKIATQIRGHVRIACDIAVRVTKPWVPPGQL